MESPVDEGFYLGAYPVMVGFDGFLRWAANSWPEEPYKDASFKTKNWKAGDTFLVYPGGELSSRLIHLRAGVVAAEKMRILMERGAGKRLGRRSRKSPSATTSIRPCATRTSISAAFAAKSNRS